MDLMIFAKISWFLRKFWVFLYFAFSSPSNHVGTLIRSLSNCTKAQGTLLDLHGPPNGPLNGPSEANFWGPLVKKGPAGSLHGPNWSIFLDRSLDNVQTWIYSLVWGQSDILGTNERGETLQDRRIHSQGCLCYKWVWGRCEACWYTDRIFH